MKLIFYIFYFIFINTFLVQAYIDPGTGSMLFAVLTGIISTLFFAGKTLFIRLKTLPFWYKKDKSTVPGAEKKKYVFYSEGKQYWNVFKPVIDEFIKRGIPCSYYTSDKEDPGLEVSSEFVKPEFIGKGNMAYSKLNMLQADICVMTTPGLDVYQLERSKGVKHYSHLLHAVDDTTLYKLFSFDYYDSMFLSGEYQKESIRELEAKRGTKKKALYVTGSTYLDVLSSKVKTLDVEKINDVITVLVSPSWGDNSLLKKFGLKLLLPLVKSEMHVILRPHPQSAISETELLESIKEGLKGFKNVEWDFSRENIASMARSDIMISDFSGIMSDFLFLFSKPVIYTRYEFDKRGYDLSDVEKVPWKFRMLKEAAVEISEENFKDVSEIIKNTIASDVVSKKIEEAKNTAWFYHGKAGEKCADALENIHSNLKN